MRWRAVPVMAPQFWLLVVSALTVGVLGDDGVIRVLRSDLLARSCLYCQPMESVLLVSHFQNVGPHFFFSAI